LPPKRCTFQRRNGVESNARAGVHRGETRAAQLKADLHRSRATRTRGDVRDSAAMRVASAGAGDARFHPERSFLLELLGRCALRDPSGAPVLLPKKAQGLLAYLAMHPARPIPRERLAALLWHESGTEQARRSLREGLMALRAALGPAAAAIGAEAGSVQLAASSHIAIDVREFERLSRSSSVQELEAARALYRDEFLLGLHVTSEPFLEWLSAERRRLSSAMSDLLYRLAQAHAQAGDIDAAIGAADRLTAFDPLREDGHRMLMQLLGAAGRRSEALKHYAICADLLRRELGVSPDRATAELAESIREGAMIEPGLATQPSSIGAPLRNSDDATGAADGGAAGAQPGLKTSIAVLPFADLSAERDQGYFADGLAEDITVMLGRVPWLFVIGSAAAAACRGRPIDVRLVGAELGVRYVLRGSVRKDGRRVRIVAQLMDAAQGGHVWAERLEGELGDLFAIQDSVATKVSAMIAPALQSLEIEHSRRKPPQNLTAYDLYLRALPRYRSTLAANEEALQFLAKAIALDPGYGAAYGLAARCYQFQRLFGWVHPADARLKEGIRLAHLAAETGGVDSEALWMAGIALAQLAGEAEPGLSLIEKSLSLNPNSASAWISSTFVLCQIGDAEWALEHFARAQRLNPLDSMHHVQWSAAAVAHLIPGRYEQAAQAIDKALSARPSYTPAIRTKVSICGLLRRKEESAEWVGRLLAVNPDASIAWLKAYWRAPLRRNPHLLETFLEGARRAGLREE